MAEAEIILWTLCEEPEEGGGGGVARGYNRAVS